MSLIMMSYMSLYMTCTIFSLPAGNNIFIKLFAMCIDWSSVIKWGKCGWFVSVDAAINLVELKCGAHLNICHANIDFPRFHVFENWQDVVVSSLQAVSFLVLLACVTLFQSWSYLKAIVIYWFLIPLHFLLLNNLFSYSYPSHTVALCDFIVLLSCLGRTDEKKTNMYINHVIRCL